MRPPAHARVMSFSKVTKVKKHNSHAKSTFFLKYLWPNRHCWNSIRNRGANNAQGGGEGRQKTWDNGKSLSRYESATDTI